MKAMIFAAGLGTRLKPLTDSMPKALVPVGGQPLLQHLLLKMKAAGINDIIVNVHHFAQQIIDFISTNDSFGLNIHISDETDELLETGGGLRKALPQIGEDEPVLVHNVDILSNLDFQHLIAAHNPNDAATLVVSQRSTSRYLLFDDNRCLCGWTNITTQQVKPEGIDAGKYKPLAFSGIQVISPRLFQYMQDMPKRFSLIDLYLHTLDKENLSAYVPTDFRMMDVGKIDTLADADLFAEQLKNNRYGLE